MKLKRSRYIPGSTYQNPLIYRNAARRQPEGSTARESLEELARTEVEIRRSVTTVKYCPVCRRYLETETNYYPNFHRNDGWEWCCKNCRSVKQRVKEAIYGIKKN